MINWNNANDCLPEFHAEVIIYSPRLTALNPLIAYRRPSNDGQWIWDLTDGSGVTQSEVSHWAPSPEEFIADLRK